jgi:apolipoprotein N-acyltransferase
MNDLLHITAVGTVFGIPGIDWSGFSVITFVMLIPIIIGRILEWSIHNLFLIMGGLIGWNVAWVLWIKPYCVRKAAAENAAAQT